DNSRYEKPLTVEVGVVPGPLFEAYLRNGCSHCGRLLIESIARVVLGKLIGDLVDVSDGNQGGIGIGPVDDDLQMRGLSLSQQLGEAGFDLERHRDVATADERFQLMLIGKDFRDFKPARKREAAQ